MCCGGDYDYTPTDEEITEWEEGRRLSMEEEYDQYIEEQIEAITGEFTEEE